MLEETGFPVAYMQFKRAPKLPYIVYYADSSSNFQADNANYHEVKNITIELYTEYKDEAAEYRIKSLLNQNKIPFDWFEQWIEKESLLLNSYEMRVL